MFTTYYIESNGQPRNSISTHTSLAEAVHAWRADYRSLIHGAGGSAAIEDADGNTLLEWIENCEGGYAGGSLVDEATRTGELDETDVNAVANYALAEAVRD